MREQVGAFKSKAMRTGGTAHFHRLKEGPTLADFRAVTAEFIGERADADVLDKVYTALLRELSLDESHRADLVRRKAGMLFEEKLYRTLPKTGRTRIVNRLREQFADEVLLSVPGFALKVGSKGKNDRYLAIAGSPGLLIPVRDDLGRIRGIKVRVDGTTVGSGKYRWLSSKQRSGLPFKGPSPGTPPHCPLGVKAPVATVRVTEGPLKADVATANGDVVTIAADSATNWRPVLHLIERLGAKIVRLSFDMDRETKSPVGAAFVRCAAALQEAGLVVEVETWPPEYKGIDDLLTAGRVPSVLTDGAVVQYLTTLSQTIELEEAISDIRPQIEIDVDEHKTNDDAIRALAADPDIYQRAGTLVQIVRGPASKNGIRRPDDAPRIVELALPTVRECLTRMAQFGMSVETENGTQFVRKHVPDWCVKAVAARGQWDAIRPLDGIVNSPILRRDGTVLKTPGYDPATRLMFDPEGVEFQISDEPTREDAIAAAARLLDLISEFPHPKPAHRSTWLAGLLTPSARFAFDGPSPLFLFDANVPGCGKTMEAELISLIQSGGDFPRMTNPANDIETRKLITALALSGDSLVLIDNIDGALGCAALDAALTGMIWKDRRLGVNEMVAGLLRITWFASGNNVILQGDTTRRVCHCRLESQEEKPEERAGFKYPNLAQFVREHRPALLADVLTILSAYCAAGRPQATLKPWGSYEGWSNLVRQAIVWAGLADPAETRQELASRSDSEANALRDVIIGWEEIDEHGTGLTAAAAMQKLKDHPDRFERLRDAVMELCNSQPSELPGARQIGNKLRRLRGRVCAGRLIDERPGRSGYKLWRVVTLDRETVRESGEFGASGELAVPRNGVSGSDNRLPNDESGDSGDSLSPIPYARAHACAPENDAHLGRSEEVPPDSPESPTGKSTDWLQNVPIVEVERADELRHHSSTCQSTRGWPHRTGELVCSDCSPPTEFAAVQRPP